MVECSRLLLLMQCSNRRDPLLHLDETGRAFIYTEDGRYRQVSAVWLVDVVVERFPLRPYEEEHPLIDAEEVP